MIKYNTYASSKVRDLMDVSLSVASVRHLTSLIPHSMEACCATASVIEEMISSRKIFIDAALLNDILGPRIYEALPNGCDDPHKLAWCLMSPAMSDRFPAFAIKYLNSEPVIMHHVPKSGGTSIAQALIDSGNYITWKIYDWADQHRMFGYVGFPSILQEFMIMNRSRFIIGGHYNLAHRISEFGLNKSISGITILRDPFTIVESALRYVWGIIDQPALYSHYDDVDLDLAIHIRERIISNEYVGRDEVEFVVKAIAHSKQFYSEYYKPLSRYYLSGAVEDSIALGEMLREMPNLWPVIDINDNLALVKGAGVEYIPKRNVSAISRQRLNEIVGDVFLSNTLAEYIDGEEKIFDVVKLRRIEMQALQ